MHIIFTTIVAVMNYHTYYKAYLTSSDGVYKILTDYEYEIDFFYNYFFNIDIAVNRPIEVIDLQFSIFALQVLSVCILYQESGTFLLFLSK